jgi:hypothetical protein
LAVYIEDDENKLNILIKCIKQLRNIYNNETIVIVDNKSKNNTWYDLAKSLNIYIIRNNSELYRYEIGAYNLALKYFRAEKYLCIQGTIFFNDKIQEVLDENKEDAYAFLTVNGYEWTDNLTRYNANKYLNMCNIDDWNNEPLVLWNCFYCNNYYMDSLINSGLLDLRCNNKDLSCAYERIHGTYMYRKLNNIKTINKNTYEKYFLGQL